MYRIVQRGLSIWHSSRRQKTQHARSRVEGWLEARPIIDFFTSDPFWLSTWDRESRKFGEVVNFSATIHRIPPLVAAPVHRLHLWTKLAELRVQSTSRGGTWGFTAARTKGGSLHCQGVEQVIHRNAHWSLRQ